MSCSDSMLRQMQPRWFQGRPSSKHLLVLHEADGSPAAFCRDQATWRDVIGLLPLKLSAALKEADLCNEPSRRMLSQLPFCVKSLQLQTAYAYDLRFLPADYFRTPEVARDLRLSAKPPTMHVTQSFSFHSSHLTTLSLCPCQLPVFQNSIDCETGPNYPLLFGDSGSGQSSSPCRRAVRRLLRRDDPLRVEQVLVRLLSTSRFHLRRTRVLIPPLQLAEGPSRFDQLFLSNEYSSVPFLARDIRPNRPD